MKFNHGRIKPKYSSKNKSSITAHEKEYLEYLQHIDEECLVCGCNGIEWHHVKRDSTDKKNHTRLIPLCPMHHRLSNELSAHGTPKKFREIYSMEIQNEVAETYYNEYISIIMQ